MSFVQVEFSPAELRELQRLVKARHVEIERMLRNVEETEGLDATKHRLRKELSAQIDLVQDVLVKVEAALAGR